MSRTRSGQAGKPGAKRQNKIVGQFAYRLIEMLESPAYRVLSLSAHRILARLEIELAHHGGNDNGKLPCTYVDFERYGVRRKRVAPAIRELGALGFAEVTQHGFAGIAEHRQPNLFRLTYRPTEYHDPTDEWRKIVSIDEAEAIAAAARKERTDREWRPKKQDSNFRPPFDQVSDPHTGSETAVASDPDTGGTASDPDTGGTIYISGRRAAHA